MELKRRVAFREHFILCPFTKKQCRTHIFILHVSETEAWAMSGNFVGGVVRNTSYIFTLKGTRLVHNTRVYTWLQSYIYL